MVSLAGHQTPRAPARSLGEYTFLLKMLVILSKPYLHGRAPAGSERTWATALAWCSRSPAPDNKSTASSIVCIFGPNAHCTVGYRRLRIVLVHLHLLGQALSSPGGDVSRTFRSTPAAGPARTYPCRRWGCCSVAILLQPTRHKPQR